MTCVPAATGGAVTLFGTNFLTGTQVGVGSVGNVAVTPTQPSQVTFTAPANPGQVGTVSTQPVTITTAGGTSASGTTLIDYYLAPATPISDTQLVATVPGGLATGAGTITVHTCGGTPNAQAFTIT
ncbi:hypothetical protein ACFY8S_32435 [Streptomyces hygroscopicus]|uniref:hypothetical protein n=1 Tax=Streptomyces hygroscopicus TaxID=1912 RepID=UPI0036857415